MTVEKTPHRRSADAQVAVLMGSDSDLPIMKDAGEALSSFGISFEMRILSAHRTPDETLEYARAAAGRGVRVIIAGAGGAAHLPGFVAAATELPVIGVPIANVPLHGEDALHSIVQMPRGVPVACVALNGAYNAGLLAAQILASGGIERDKALVEKFRAFKREMRDKVLAKKL